VNGTAKHLHRESSANGGWLSSFFGDDVSAQPGQGARRRLIFAFALAIGIHEIFAGLFPWGQHTIAPAPKETITIAKITRIEHRPKPTPTPRPKPKPTPRPIVHAKVIAETHVKPRIVNPGNPSQQHHVKRIASARPLVHTRFHSKPATVHVPMGGQGAGTSKKAKALVGGIGPGGTGTGESGSGTGSGGAPAAHEPCGYVEFEPNDSPTVDKPTGRIWEHIAMKVHFPDGSEQSVDLSYLWYYPSKSVDPFMPGNDNVPATFQFPPADHNANQSPLVEYVIAHTTPDGFTTLRDCPK
jgi:hypothetical protein